LQRFLHLGPQLLGADGGGQAARVAGEQRIAEQIAQPRQRLAHRRLRTVQAARGAAHMVFHHQRIEHQQQVEILYHKPGL
jgi:hypothetical protein